MRLRFRLRRGPSGRRHCNDITQTPVSIPVFVMTHLRPFTIASVVFLGLLLPATASLAAVVAPKPVNMVQPVSPPELAHQGIDGTAVVMMRIDAKGVVTDATVVSANEPGFGEAAVAAAKQWTFQPATRDGQPIAIKVQQPFNFPAPANRKLCALAGREVFGELTEVVVETSDLDAAPILLNWPETTFPAELAGSRRAPVITVSFVLTPTGQAVNPEIEGDKDEEFAMPVLSSLVMSRWEPPQQAGKPVHARMKIEVKVAEGKAADVRTVK